MKLEPTMFREYDLRGLVNDSQLNAQSISQIARAYAVMLVKNNIKNAVLGYDYRSYSQSLAEAVQAALLSSGIDVISLGMVSTPMMYASQYYYQTKGGVMITASHNPNGWSGIKMALGYSHTLVPSEMKLLHSLADNEKSVSGQGKLIVQDCFPAYFADLKIRVSLNKKLKLVVNTANGGIGKYLPGMLRNLGMEVIDLNTNLDWTFPHYNPNPSSVEMMEDTGKKVTETGADLGIAIDADGDRLGLTDEKGQTVWPDKWMMLLSRHLLKKYPGRAIVFDVKCSQGLEEDIKEHGGVPIMWKTGHSYIKEKLAETNAIMGGELSGHIFINQPEYYGFDDAIFTCFKILEYLCQSNKTFSQLLSDTPQYFSSPTYQAFCDDKIKYQTVDKLTKEFRQEGREVIDINGARVKFGDGWGLVRASSNLPVLVLRFEAKSQSRLKEIEEDFKNRFKKYPEIGTEWETG
ncbi:MAG: phosphomannomutase/phosphoglucomutase [Patescibacteria group bacterium]|nr:phosphomannomutase/phosphoglucomutase [Patescibacteria group bacterium]